MKNAVLISLVLFLGFAACQNAQPKAETKPETTAAPAPATTTAAAPEAVYCCPMHPEITGKKGDKCSKCKMDLEEKKAPATAEVYACPMHPEITGKAGDKCSKCHMDLKPVKK